MSIGQRVSFFIGQAKAYGTVVSDQMASGYLVAVDANYVSGSAGVLRITCYFPAVSLTAVS